MSDIFLKISAALALVAALFFAEQHIEGRGYDRAKAEDTAALAQQKTQAADQLALETDKTRATERALQALKNTQELQDATHQKTIADLSSRLHTLADNAGRLRDPHAAGCGPSGSSTPSAATPAPGDSAANPANAGGLLSADLSGLLQRLTAEADTINIAYASCRADAIAVRGLPPTK